MRATPTALGPGAGADDGEGAAKRVERALTTSVLRGEYPVGARLPTMRELASRFGVNVGTVQRAAASLERTGLVSARQGSGIRVNDVRAAADLSMVPAWIEALADQPARAAALLAEFLEVRRVLATHLIVKHRRQLAEHAEALAAAAQHMVTAADSSVGALRDADLALARALVERTGNTVVSMVLNAAAELLDVVPGLAEAMYAAPDENLRSTGVVLDAVSSKSSDARVRVAVEEAFAGVDRRTVERFEAQLAARSAPGRKPGS